MLTLNRSRRILKCVVIGVLFTCVLLGLSSAPIYAASEEVDPPSSSEVPSLVVPEEYLDPVYDKLASGDVRAVEYSTTDIYNLLYSALRGQDYSSSYSLPQMASYLNRISQMIGGPGQSVPSSSQSLIARINSILSAEQKLVGALVDGNNDYIPVGPGIRQMLYGISDDGGWDTIFDVAKSQLEFLQHMYASLSQIHGDGQNNTYQLSQVNSALGTTNSTLSTISSNVSSLSSNLSDLETLNWVNFNASYVGTSLGYNSNYLNSPTAASEFYTFFYTQDQYSTFPNLARINIPMYVQSNAYTGAPPIDEVEIIFSGTPSNDIGFDWFTEPCGNGFYLYLINFNQRSTGEFCVHLKLPTNYIFMTSPGSISYLPFDSYDYHMAKISFYQNKTANSIGSVSDAASSLANYIVSPEKQAAEDASQAVIDDTLDGFTGSGSAAAKTSDTGAMKNMSGSIQSGLNGGGSASDATSVFNTGSDLWSWFTQATSDGINSPYPAPQVQNTRGDGDYIPDFISGDKSALDALRDRRDRW